MKTVRSEMRKVLRADACTGCGLCAVLDSGLDMKLNEDGFTRPVEVARAQEVADAARIFRHACPGRSVTAVKVAGAQRHPILGAYLGVWDSWATDPAVRRQASSGGALTAINTWLLDSKTVDGVTTATADRRAPTNTVPVRLTTKEEALAAAGSRYAPVAVAQAVEFGGGHAFAAKPCEVAAVRAMSAASSVEAPILLSFFCAGTPSQTATTQLIEQLGVPEERPISQMWYRGHGWPGRFTATYEGGSASASYSDSWGKVLGRHTQWRCKICVDGVGESADVVAADLWETDESGYPQFAEGDGHSALIARTDRGLALIRAAEAAGVIHLQPLSVDRLAGAQPLHDDRRRFLAARLLGTIMAGRAVPIYRGFGLIAMSLARPRQAIRVLRGARRRVLAARETSSTQHETAARR